VPIDAQQVVPGLSDAINFSNTVPFRRRLTDDDFVGPQKARFRRTVFLHGQIDVYFEFCVWIGGWYHQQQRHYWGTTPLFPKTTMVYCWILSSFEDKSGS
jgi:hypothetical protein